jgi:cytochrome c553
LTRIVALVIAAAIGSVLSASASAEAFPDWAFPTCPKILAPPAAETAPLQIPGSQQSFSAHDIREISITKDWFPSDHGSLPLVIARSHAPDKYACGYCHLPDGAGRPENAKVSGLPAAYIVMEVNALRGEQRRSARGDYKPSLLMRDAVAELTDEEIRAAAEYFSQQSAKTFLRVVEQARVPANTEACFVFKRTGHGTQTLGTTIVEMPDDFARFEARDPRVTYTAYVPPGSLARGRALAEDGKRTPPCASCHGAGLAGDEYLPGPPLAGRFATYLFRQLYGFKTASRAEEAALEMRAIVAQLSQADMIDLAAYAASLPPK